MDMGNACVSRAGWGCETAQVAHLRARDSGTDFSTMGPSLRVSQYTTRSGYCLHVPDRITAPPVCLKTKRGRCMRLAVRQENSFPWAASTPSAGA